MLFIFDYKTLWAPFMVQLRKRFNSRRLISKSMEQSGIKPQGRRFKSYLRSQKKHDVKVMLFIFDYKTLWAPFMVQLRKRFNSRRLISKSMEQSGIKPQGRRFKSYLRSQKKHDAKVMLLFFSSSIDTYTIFGYNNWVIKGEI